MKARPRIRRTAQQKLNRREIQRGLSAKADGPLLFVLSEGARSRYLLYAL